MEAEDSDDDNLPDPHYTRDEPLSILDDVNDDEDWQEVKIMMITNLLAIPIMTGYLKYVQLLSTSEQNFLLYQWSKDYQSMSRYVPQKWLIF